MGHLVVIKAVIIITNNGIDAILVTKPNNINKPQRTSKLPVKYAQNAG
jgi:hypothetical protein